MDMNTRNVGPNARMSPSHRGGRAGLDRNRGKRQAGMVPVDSAQKVLRREGGESGGHNGTQDRAMPPGYEVNAAF